MVIFLFSKTPAGPLLGANLMNPLYGLGRGTDWSPLPFISAPAELCLLLTLANVHLFNKAIKDSFTPIEFFHQKTSKPDF